MRKNQHRLIDRSLINRSGISYLSSGLCTILFVMMSNNSWALKTDTTQPMYIDADKQQIDMKTNTVTFTGKVHFSQGSIKIDADKAVIVRPDGRVGMEVVYTYGSPATFEQKLDDGTLVNGDSLRMKYVAKTQFLYLYDKAHLLHNGNHVYGDNINYDVQNEILIANRSDTERVKTIINNTETTNKKDATVTPSISTPVSKTKKQTTTK